MKKWFAVASFAVVVGLGTWAYMWWHGATTTSVVTVGDQTQTVVLGGESKLLVWETAVFATRYPDILRVITTNEVPHGITTGQYLLGSMSLKQDDQLAVTVGQLGTMRFDELPAVKLRRLQADTYQSAERSFAPAGGLVFQKTDGYETSVFWTHGNTYAAVVASGSPARRAELENALQAVVANWQWR